MVSLLAEAHARHDSVFVSATTIAQRLGVHYDYVRVMRRGLERKLGVAIHRPQVTQEGRRAGRQTSHTWLVGAILGRAAELLGQAAPGASLAPSGSGYPGSEIHPIQQDPTKNPPKEGSSNTTTRALPHKRGANPPTPPAAEQTWTAGSSSDPAPGNRTIRATMPADPRQAMAELIAHGVGQQVAEQLVTQHPGPVVAEGISSLQRAMRRGVAFRSSAAAYVVGTIMRIAAAARAVELEATPDDVIAWQKARMAEAATTGRCRWDGGRRWQEILEQLQLQLPAEIWGRWQEGTTYVGSRGGVDYIRVGGRLHREQLEEDREDLDLAVMRLGYDVRIELVVCVDDHGPKVRETAAPSSPAPEHGLGYGLLVHYGVNAEEAAELSRRNAPEWIYQVVEQARRRAHQIENLGGWIATVVERGKPGKGPAAEALRRQAAEWVERQTRVLPEPEEAAGEVSEETAPEPDLDAVIEANADEPVVELEFEAESVGESADEEPELEVIEAEAAADEISDTPSRGDAWERDDDSDEPTREEPSRGEGIYVDERVDEPEELAREFEGRMLAISREHESREERSREVPINPQKQRAWRQLLVAMEREIGPDNVRMWLGEARLVGSGSGVDAVEVPNRYVKAWVEEELLDAMRRLGSRLGLRPVIVLGAEA